jgi:hypothetical protein
MTMRKALLVALVAVAAIGLAHVVMADSSRTAPEGPSALTALPDVAPACGVQASMETSAPLPGGDSSQQPVPVVGCQAYAYQCVFDGGPCGPNGVCHCQDRPTGWVCAR